MRNFSARSEIARIDAVSVVIPEISGFTFEDTSVCHRIGTVFPRQRRIELFSVPSLVYRVLSAPYGVCRKRIVVAVLIVEFFRLAAAAFPNIVIPAFEEASAG